MVYAAQGWYAACTRYVTLSWRPSRSLDTVGYEVWLSRLPGGPYYLVDTVSGKSASRHTLPNLPPGTYYFVMTGVDRRGNRSRRSNEVEHTV